MENELGIRATTLYDKPRKNIQESDKDMRKELGVLGFFIVSSTSWTEDEDFSIVISTLDRLENRLNSDYVTLVITGKGPLKEHYRNLIKMKDWKKSKVVFAWLEAEDYPVVLKQADLGVCLHTSSSGYDLPMKVVDMHGGCLPVLAYYYKTIEELIVVNKNGDLFRTSDELAEKIEFLIRNPKILENYKEELKKIKNESYWETV